MVLSDSFELSGKHVGREQLVSVRDKNQGRGSFPERMGTDGIKEKLLYGQYITSKFSSAAESKSDSRNLDYEIEYLIGGNETDEENLKDVVGKLLLVRMGLNYTYLMTDMGRQGEAETMAAAFAAIVLSRN